jgi:hypothetical protein
LQCDGLVAARESHRSKGIGDSGTSASQTFDSNGNQDSQLELSGFPSPA